MSEQEKLDLILSEIQGMKTEINGVKTEVQGMKADMQDLKQRVTGLELHIENHTDRNIRLIAENFIDLTRKLNEAIPAADKSLAYEVKVDYIGEEVKQLKKEVEELKCKIA